MLLNLGGGEIHLLHGPLFVQMLLLEVRSKLLSTSGVCHDRRWHLGHGLFDRHVVLFVVTRKFCGGGCLFQTSSNLTRFLDRSRYRQPRVTSYIMMQSVFTTRLGDSTIDSNPESRAHGYEGDERLPTNRGGIPRSPASFSQFRYSGKSADRRREISPSVTSEQAENTTDISAPEGLLHTVTCASAAWQSQTIKRSVPADAVPVPNRFRLPPTKLPSLGTPVGLLSRQSSVGIPFQPPRLTYFFVVLPLSRYPYMSCYQLMS